MRNLHKKPTAEQRKAWDAKYYQAHKKEIQAVHKMYRDACIEKAREYNRNSYYRNHERSLELRRIRNCKRIFKEQYDKLVGIFQAKTFEFSPEIKRNFLSMLNAEMYLDALQREQRNQVPDPLLASLYEEVNTNYWEYICADTDLQERMKRYIENTDLGRFDKLTSKK